MGDEEIREHRGSRDEGAEDEDEAVLPETFQEFLIGQHKGGEKYDQNEGGDAEGDIGMKSQAKDSASDEEITEAVRAQSAEEEVEGKSQEKGRHDGSEADAREVDSPVGGGEHESSQESGTFAVEELAPEQVDAEH